MNTQREPPPPPEGTIVGRWIKTDGGVVGDESCRRIESLVEHCFERVAEHPDEGGWRTLFRDPRDGRMWERTFPESQMHGGGPPALKQLSPEEARREFKL